MTYYSGETIHGDWTDEAVRTVAGRSGIHFSGEGTFENLTLSGNVNRTFTPNAYVLCFSLERLRKFGAHCVRVDDIGGFFRSVSASLGRKYKIIDSGIGSVEYRERVYRHLDPAPSRHPAFIKPPTFEDEKEVRMLWVVDNPDIKPRFLDCPRARRYCTLLPPIA